MEKNKLTPAEKKIKLAEFNKMYSAVADKQREIIKKMKQLRQEARAVDALAKRAFWYANNNLYYDTDHGIECVNKRTANRTECLDDLRTFSYNIFVDMPD